MLKLNDEYKISRINSVNTHVPIQKSSQKMLYSILHLSIEILLLLSTIGEYFFFSISFFILIKYN